MATHRYWRLVIHATSANTDVYTVAELQGQTTPGGTVNVLTAGTASASTTLNGYVAGNAFDGSFGNFWASSNYADPTTLTYDLGVGVTQDIPQIKMWSRSDGYTYQTPRTFDWQFSDDAVTWTTYFTVTNFTWSSSGQSQIFPLGSGGPPFDQVDAFAVEVLSPGVASAQAVAFAVEVLSPGTPGLQVLDFAVETLSPGTASPQTMAFAVEILRSLTIASSRRRQEFLTG